MNDLFPPKDRVLEEQQQQERNEAMVSHWGNHGDIITETDMLLWKQRRIKLEKEVPISDEMLWGEDKNERK
jgi:hypothetical protein